MSWSESDYNRGWNNDGVQYPVLRQFDWRSLIGDQSYQTGQESGKPCATDACATCPKNGQCAPEPCLGCNGYGGVQEPCSTCNRQGQWGSQGQQGPQWQGQQGNQSQQQSQWGQQAQGQWQQGNQSQWQGQYGCNNCGDNNCGGCQKKWSNKVACGGCNRNSCGGCQGRQQWQGQQGQYGCNNCSDNNCGGCQKKYSKKRSKKCGQKKQSGKKCGGCNKGGCGGGCQKKQSKKCNTCNKGGCGGGCQKKQSKKRCGGCKKSGCGGGCQRKQSGKKCGGCNKGGCGGGCQKSDKCGCNRSSCNRCFTDESSKQSFSDFKKKDQHGNRNSRKLKVSEHVKISEKEKASETFYGETHQCSCSSAQHESCEWARSCNCRSSRHSKCSWKDRKSREKRHVNHQLIISRKIIKNRCKQDSLCCYGKTKQCRCKSNKHSKCSWFKNCRCKTSRHESCSWRERASRMKRNEERGLKISRHLIIDKQYRKSRVSYNNGHRCACRTAQHSGNNCSWKRNCGCRSSGHSKCSWKARTSRKKCHQNKVLHISKHLKISKKFKNSETNNTYSKQQKGKQSGDGGDQCGGRKCGCGMTKSSWKQESCGCGVTAQTDWKKKSWKWGKAGKSDCNKGLCVKPNKKWGKKVKVKGRRFTVTVVDKQGHPWSQHCGGPMCFAIDGVKGRTLHLNRGSTYVFDISQGNVQGFAILWFLLTSDPMGGNPQCKLPMAPPPMSNGSMTVTIDHSYPSTCYYNSSTSRAVGGLIVIHERK